MKQNKLVFLYNALAIFALSFLTALAVMLFISPAFAAEIVSDPTLVESAVKIGWLSSGFALLLQLAKSDLLGGLFAKVDEAYQPAVVLLLGQLAGLVDSIANGKKFGPAALEWLLVSGNAMALYSVIIKPFKKKKV